MGPTTSWRDGRRALPAGQEVLLGLGLANPTRAAIRVVDLEVECSGGEASPHRETAFLLAPGEERIVPIRIRTVRDAVVTGTVVCDERRVALEARSLPVSLVDSVHVRATGTRTGEVADVHLILEVPGGLDPCAVDVEWVEPATGLYDGPRARRVELAPRAVLDFKTAPIVEATIRLTQGGVVRDRRIPVEFEPLREPEAPADPAPLAQVTVEAFDGEGFTPAASTNQVVFRIVNRRMHRVSLRVAGGGLPLREVHVPAAEHVTVLKEEVQDDGRTGVIYAYVSAAAIWPIPLTLAFDLVHEGGARRRITRKFVVLPTLKARFVAVAVFALLAFPGVLMELESRWKVVGVASYVVLGIAYLLMSQRTSPEILVGELFDSE